MFLLTVPTRTIIASVGLSIQCAADITKYSEIIVPPQKKRGFDVLISLIPTIAFMNIKWDNKCENLFTFLSYFVFTIHGNSEDVAGTPKDARLFREKFSFVFKSV